MMYTETVLMKYAYVVDFSLAMMIILIKSNPLNFGEKNGNKMDISGFLKRQNHRLNGIHSNKLDGMRMNSNCFIIGVSCYLMLR